MKLILLLSALSISFSAFAGDGYKLNNVQINAFQKCFDSFKNYSETTTFTVPVKPNRLLLMIPDGTSGIIIYPSDGSAFKSPLANINWEYGARHQLYFYTKGSEKAYTEYLIHYETSKSGYGYFTDKALYTKDVSSKKKFLFDRTMNSKFLKNLDRGINSQLLVTSLQDLPTEKQTKAEIDDKPLLNELKRLLDKMDSSLHTKYSKRDFENGIGKSCSDISSNAKNLIEEYKNKFENKPEIQFGIIDLNEANAKHE